MLPLYVSMNRAPGWTEITIRDEPAMERPIFIQSPVIRLAGLGIVIGDSDWN
jgi:hypothetical protein